MQTSYNVEKQSTKAEGEAVDKGIGMEAELLIKRIKRVSCRALRKCSSNMDCFESQVL